MKENSIIILLAAERSGTHLLRSILTQNGSAFAPGEVANAAATRISENSNTNFFEFRHNFIQSGEGKWIPSPKNAEELISNFLDHCVSQNLAGKQFVCDVKYSHIHNFSAGWWDMISRPTLLDFAIRAQIPVIHLVRRRVFETCVSDEYAAATGVWRAWRQEDIRHQTIVVDRDKLIARAARVRRVIDLVKGWLVGGRVINMYYEDLLDKSSQSWADLNKILWRSVEDIKFRSLKTTPPYTEIIANYSAIQDLLGEEIGADQSGP